VRYDRWLVGPHRKPPSPIWKARTPLAPSSTVQIQRFNAQLGTDLPKHFAKRVESSGRIIFWRETCFRSSRSASVCLNGRSHSHSLQRLRRMKPLGLPLFSSTLDDHQIRRQPAGNLVTFLRGTHRHVRPISPEQAARQDDCGRH